MASDGRTGVGFLDAPDELVVGRVRAAIERAVSHPSAIAAHVRAGRVTLSGPVLTHEAHDLLRRVIRVDGVRRLRDDLERHRNGKGVPMLQGRGRRPGPDQKGPPAWRLLKGAAGIALGGYGARRGGPLGIAIAAAGGAMLLRALTNRAPVDAVALRDRDLDGQPG